MGAGSYYNPLLTSSKVMRCLIVDDEAPARLEMRRLLSQDTAVEIVGEAEDVETALELTALHHPEVVFLDIKLRGESGFDYVGRAQEPLPHLVFVTAFDRYAVRGFECNALDYLLKPVQPDRLAETLRRVRSREPVRHRATDSDAVFIKTGSRARFIPWGEVQHIISEGNYTRIFLENAPSFLMLRPLKEWLDLAPTGDFLQVHRKALVRLSAIREIQNLGLNRRQIMLTDGQLIPLGRAFWPGLKVLLGRV
jgi:two-component system LytT family response regulator